MNDRTEYENQQELVAKLLKCRPFPGAVQTVRLVETHISWVLLAGHYAYKIKKAVNLGFLDFTGLEVRRRYCEEEIRLNRRLAPSIYLDVVSIGESSGNPEFGAQPAIEYAVRMRRFAMSGQLDKLLARGKLLPEIMDRLAASMAAFHDRIPHAEPDTAFGTPATILDVAMQNFDHLQSLLTEKSDLATVATLRKISQNEFAACNRFIEQRRAMGFVRECHGDLHLGNIVLLNQEPVPFDGIEFSPGLRWIDVMSEVAFLVMDLLHSRRDDLAYRFLNAWLETTGDYAGIVVLRFYLAYRAAVRAKVNGIRVFQARRANKPALAACRSYLVLAKECFVRRSALIITHGLPGSGKSTFALAAVERLRAIRIRSDVERKRLFGMNPLDDSRSGTGAGIYSAEATHLTYTRLFELSRGILEAGFPLIVDAAFIKREEREKFRYLAEGMQVPFVIVSMQAGDTVLRARIRQRRDSANDASEADLDVLQKLQNVQQPLEQHESVHAVKMLNEGDGFTADIKGWDELNRLLAAQGY